MKQIKIKSISKIEHNSKRYDISVADNNNLFVNNILIHNCQNLNYEQILDTLGDKQVYITEKIDGQSGTFTTAPVRKYPWIGKFSPITYKFIVCSRNFTTDDRESNYWKIAKKYNLEKILKQNPSLTIQGEIWGPKIQGNKYRADELQFSVFNVIDHKKNYHFNFNELVKFCNLNNLQYVPPVWPHSPSLKSLGTREQILEFCKGYSILANTEREGIVIRCIEDGKKVLSFKAINNDFLLKWE